MLYSFFFFELCALISSTHYQGKKKTNGQDLFAHTKAKGWVYKAPLIVLKFIKPINILPFLLASFKPVFVLLTYPIAEKKGHRTFRDYTNSG